MAKASKAKGATKLPQGKSEKASEPPEVVVSYDLMELPTAFHKAGLAGLVLLLESLQSRRVIGKSEVNCQVSASTLKITFTESLLQKLMDDLYDAQFKDVAVKAKWQGAEISRPPSAAEKEAGTPFVYRVVQPVGQFLRDSFPQMPDDRSWLKLWREMIWNITRGRPTTREPYNQRASHQPCKEGRSAWADLQRVLKARSKNEFYTSEVSSALLPGAQATNAEGVPFKGRAEENLLLHFWPLAVLLYAPQQVDSDGSTEFVGYTIAVPEVLNLRQFTQDYVSLLNALNDGLKPEHAARGFRPTRSVIDLPAEGALALLDQLSQITGQKVEQGELRLSIGGVEYLHLVKLGNNVKTMASGRISPNSELLEEYHDLVNPPDESRRYRNPLFRRGLLVALLDGGPWYRPFSQTLAMFNAELFIRQPRRGENPAEKGVPQFANDALKRFQFENGKFTRLLERMKSMPETERAREKAPLPVIVNRVVRTYVLSRASEKSGVKLEQFESDDKVDWSKVPPDFNDTKQKLAQSLLLEFRSRKDQAFVDHFAATFFSVTQRFAEADRLDLADALTTPDRRDDLKTLTLLSLSANS